MALLERYYEPAGGSILVDDVPISDYETNFLRKHIALVTQEPQLFSTTIRNNIAYGVDAEVSQADIEQAARAANAHDFIAEFEKGYETLVGDKGVQLSGGQRQRIAIARALLRKADIKMLLLDEATSALDSQSERLVHEALERARQGRTTIMIAHRLSTVRSADAIAVVDSGRVAELGTHTSLMAAQGIYYRLCMAQAVADADEEQRGQADLAGSTAEGAAAAPAAAAGAGGADGGGGSDPSAPSSDGVGRGPEGQGAAVPKGAQASQESEV